MEYKEIVIKIPEKDYDNMCRGKLIDTIVVAIKNGIVLSKGHGGLIDADRLKEVIHRNTVGDLFDQLIDMQPTIIEADNESEEV